MQWPITAAKHEKLVLLHAFTEAVFRAGVPLSLLLLPCALRAGATSTSILVEYCGIVAHALMHRRKLRVAVVQLQTEMYLFQIFLPDTRPYCRSSGVLDEKNLLGSDCFV